MQIILPATPPSAGIATIDVPTGYEEPAKRAFAAVAIGGLSGIPRYASEIPSHWRRPTVTAAFEDPGGDEHLTTQITIKGSVVKGSATLREAAGSLLARREKRASASTTACATQVQANGASVAPTTLPARTRGRCKGNSARSFKNYIARLKSTYTHPGQLVGRSIHATFSPCKRWGKKKILKIMAKIRKELKACCVQFGLWTIGKMSFAKDQDSPFPLTPHWHALILLPSHLSMEESAALSERVRKRIDAVWRKHNHFGLMPKAWQLKRSVKAVKACIKYLCDYETDPAASEPWGKPTFEFGRRPSPPEFGWETTPEQYRTVWAALCVAGSRKSHPWAVNFVFGDIDIRLLLMILLAAGVVVTEAQLAMFRDDW